MNNTKQHNTQNHQTKKKKKNKNNKPKVDTKVVQVTTTKRIAPKSSNIGKNEKAVMSTVMGAMERERKKKNQDIVKIILSMSAPRDHPPVRLGAQLASYPTAIANPQQVITGGFTPRETSEPDSCSAFLFRDPFRFAIISNVDTGATEWRYTTIAPGNLGVNGTMMPLQLPRFGNSAGDKVHGQFLYPGFLPGSNRTYFPLSVGNVIEFTNLQPTAVQTIFRTYIVDSRGNINSLNNTTVNQGATVQIAGAGSDPVSYVGFDVSISSAAGTLLGNFVIRRGSGTAVWSHLALPGVDTNITACDAIKIYAASLMFTNEAAPLYRQGKLAASQLPQGVDWRDYLGYDSVASTKGAYRDQVLAGYYGFLKPTQYSDLEFIENSEVDNGVLVSAAYPLNTKSDFLAFNMKVSNPLGRDGYFTIDCAFEYRTVDQWRAVALPEIPGSTVSEALQMVAALPQHHENDFHISDIFSWIKDRVSDVWSGVKEAIPSVLSGLQTAGHVATALAPFMV